MGPGKRERRELTAFFSGTLEGDGGTLALLHRGWGSHLPLNSWAWCPEDCILFPRVPIPLFPPAFGERARGSPRPHFLLSTKSGGGKELDTKAHARPLPSRQGVDGSPPLQCARALQVYGWRACLLLPRVLSFKK